MAETEIAKDVLKAASDHVEALGFSRDREIARVVARAILSERHRCLGITNGWLIAHGETGAQLRFTTPQEYANGAVQDIADLIQDGTPSP